MKIDFEDKSEVALQINGTFGFKRALRILIPPQNTKKPLTKVFWNGIQNNIPY
jgi:hypothetical protein